MSSNLKFLIIAALAFSFGASACSSRRKVKKSSMETDPSAADSGRDGASASDGERMGGYTDSMDVEEARIRGKEFVAAADLQAVRFDYDAYSLSEQSRDTLRTNAAFLKGNPSVEVLVEGHCDDRGTNEYNLALGQKRAKAVRDYYIRLGVPGRSVATISFGEERLSCMEATSECWSENRRAVTKIRSQVSSTDREGLDDGR